MNNSNTFGNGTGLKPPAQLTDLNADPKMRAQVLEAYTARLMDFPQATWNAQERSAIQEQVQSVLKGLGR